MGAPAQYNSKKIPGNKIYLKKLAKSNLKNCIRWLKDVEINRYLSENVKNIDYPRELEWYNSIKYSDSDLVFAIYIKTGNIHIGNCGLHKIDHKNRSCELGIFIGNKDYLNKGFGTDSLQTLISFALNSLGIQRITLIVYEYNTRAINVYKNLGFVITSVLEKHHHYNDMYWNAYQMEYLA